MKKQKRFRASIYIDIFIEEIKIKICGGQEIEEYKDLEEMREEAKRRIQEVVDEITNTENKNIPDEVFNPYVGGVAAYNTRDLLRPLDREI